jgi:tight adherence protein B
LAGALRAGAGVQSALRHIVPQSPAPLAQEFGLMLREQRMGVSFEHALAALYRRMPTEGAALVVSCLTIAAQSGGSLAETLDGIADALRARLHLLGRIQALTSQGRMQAWVMAGLPFALALALSYLDPESMSALWGSPLGWAVLAVVGMLEFMGILFIRRIVNIDV